MTDPNAKLSYQQLSVLDLPKAHVQSQRDAIKTLESKAQHNFTIINIIVAIVAALNLELGAADEIQQIINERPLLVLVFVGYMVVVYLSIRTLVLRTQATEPMEVSLENAQEWSRCGLEHHYDILMKSYVQIHEHNHTIVELKGRRVQWAHRLIAATVALVILEASGLWPQIASLAENVLSLLRR
ncbi:MAG: hypothetical protein OXG53_11525 [Chloroflexi bacterium]|nr:hypothetical protein [Chloroflexota bacterium]